MRVIAGAYRSRQITAPPGKLVRPTSDRLRETLFSIIGSSIENCHFLDLYAGTGAVGIEALSRGAAHVSFAEKARPALQALRGNLFTLGIEASYTLEALGTRSLLQRLLRLGRSADIVFLDPPYEADAEYSATLSFLGGQGGGKALSDGAIVIAEHSAKVALEPRVGNLLQTRRLKQGDAALTFYRSVPAS